MYKNRIKSHRVAVHKIGGLQCPSCDYVVSEPWVLSQHVKFMHKWVSIYISTYVMFGCSSEFLVIGCYIVSNSRMKDLNGTEEDMRFKCKFCDYKATQKSHLLCHERAIHKQVLSLWLKFHFYLFSRCSSHASSVASRAGGRVG